MNLPAPLIQSLQGLPGFDAAQFVAVHQSSERVTSIRINTTKFSVAAAEQHFKHLGLQATPVPWCAEGLYLSNRPSFTFDPLFHAGCYYVQEASSMFVGWLLQQLLPLTDAINVLDLSAAPGGKSTHLQNLISPDSMLVCNEVIKSRVGVLTNNLIKWGATNAVVTHSDPAQFGQLPAFFDVLVIDAPCSGSGLFRKDPEAISHWSEAAVNLCSARQQRIVADAVPCLKEGGLLIYSTCSYSAAENEQIVAGLLQHGMQPAAVAAPAGWGLVQTGAGSFRFYPHLLQGEGFFAAAFIKKSSSAVKYLKEKSLPVATPAEKLSAAHYVQLQSKQLYKFGAALHAWPLQLHSALAQLANNIKTIYAGVHCGELAHQKMIPAHPLAVCSLVHNAPPLQLSYDEAIKYLQRAPLDAATGGRGWHLATYQNAAMGWANVLPNRLNNYYPKEMRILKTTNDSELPK